MALTRVLPLTGVHNFRDYGGYSTRGGGRLKTGILWRSAHHEAATDADLEQIDGLDLRAVIDLRGDDERLAHPCRRSLAFAGEVLFAGGKTAGLGPHLAAAQGGVDVETARARMTDIYTDMPYRGPLVATLRLYFKALSGKDSPSLVHCVAGKDRTGFAVAVLHHLIGVHEDDAMQDYLMTNVAGNIEGRIAQGAAHMRAHYQQEISDDAVRTLMSVDEIYLNAALNSITQQHGNIEHYAEVMLGVDAHMRDELRSRLAA